MGVRFFTCAILIGVSVRVSASDIREHVQITNIAIKNYENCHNHDLNALTKSYILSSNVDEDLDLARKWLSYSHYYNPHKKLAIWRYTSDVRVRDLQGQDPIRLLGHVSPSIVGAISHHVQDAAVPAHVVPVKHWLNDEFEAYFKDHPDTHVDVNCAILWNQKVASPEEILKETAEGTLKAVEGVLPAKVNGISATVPWAYFWAQTDGTGFGSYGGFGNNFGHTHIDLKDGFVDIDPEVYETFHQHQVQLAVEGTMRVLEWFYADPVRLLTRNDRL